MAFAITGIRGDKDSFDNRPNRKRKVLDSLKKQPMEERPTHPVWLISRLPQACVISYGGESIMVPARCPKGQLYVDNGRLLGKLPSGIMTVPKES